MPNDFNDFFHSKTYRTSDGSVTPLRIFVRRFAKFLHNYPDRQLYWLQHDRIRHALTRAGVTIGIVATTPSGKSLRDGAVVCLANIAGPGAWSLSHRAIEYDPQIGWLAPRDLKKGETP